MLRASVIVPTRNKSRYLALTIASLARQTESRSLFEVIVVDDGSDDDTREIVAKHRADLALNYIRRAHQGRAAARNAAIRAAKGEILIFCDDDRITHPAFVAEHIAAHASTGTHTDAPSVVLGRQRAILTRWSHDLPIAAADIARLVVRNPDIAAKLAEPEAQIVEPAAIHDAFDATVAAFELPETWWERHVGPLVERFGPTLEGFAFPWSTASTGNLSAPRVLVERIGMFDETFVGWGLEDTELHLRLSAAGARTHVIEGGLNWHQLHPRSPDNAVEWTRNAIRLLDKHPTLDVTLYLRVIRRRLALDVANRIAHEARANPAGTRELVGELVRLHREHFEMLVATL